LENLPHEKGKNELKGGKIEKEKMHQKEEEQ